MSSLQSFSKGKGQKTGFIPSIQKSCEIKGYHTPIQQMGKPQEWTGITEAPVDLKPDAQLLSSQP